LNNGNDKILKFSDHHYFSDSEILEIKNTAKEKLIITTEKDYVRLKDSILKEKLFHLPVKSSFLSDKIIFDKTILDYLKISLITVLRKLND
jgi:tetraacyldisaccharide 4'-kinase